MYLFLMFLFTFCIAYMIKVRRSRLYREVFKLPPALPEVPIIGIGLNFLGNSEDVMKQLTAVSYNSLRRGGAVRLYMFHEYYIGLTDAADISEALSLYLDKGLPYSFLQVVTGNGSVFAPASIAKVRRRIYMPSFTQRMLNGYIDTFWEESERLADQLAAHAGSGPFCVEEYLNLFVFNTILNASGVKDLGPGYSGTEFYDSISISIKCVTERLARFWLHPNITYKFSSNFTETERNRKILNKNAYRVIEKRRNDLKYNNQPVTKQDSNNVHDIPEGIFDSLIKSKLSDEEIKEEIIVLLGANDLTSTSLGYALILLGLYPLVQDEVYKELEDIFGDSNRPLVRDDLTKMSCLDRVIKETLRLYPPAPVIARVADKEATLSSGRIVPAGAGIAAFIFGLHRNPKYWGPQADNFDPDRFLPERFEKVHPKAYIPFSYGLRNCIGYNYGLVTMKLAITAILRKYKIVGESAKGPVPDIRTKFEIFMRPVNHFEIELVNRI